MVQDSREAFLKIIQRMVEVQEELWVQQDRINDLFDNQWTLITDKGIDWWAVNLENELRWYNKVYCPAITRLVKELLEAITKWTNEMN